MGQDMPDIDPSAIEVDGGDKPISVSTYVEDDQPSDPVSARERHPQLIKILEVRLLCDRIPSGKRLLTLRMAIPKLTQGLAGNDVHRPRPPLTLCRSTTQEARPLVRRMISPTPRRLLDYPKVAECGVVGVPDEERG